MQICGQEITCENCSLVWCWLVSRCKSHCACAGVRSKRFFGTVPEEQSSSQRPTNNDYELVIRAFRNRTRPILMIDTSSACSRQRFTLCYVRTCNGRQQWITNGSSFFSSVRETHRRNKNAHKKDAMKTRTLFNRKLCSVFVQTSFSFHLVVFLFYLFLFLVAHFAAVRCRTECVCVLFFHFYLSIAMFCVDVVYLGVRIVLWTIQKTEA